MPILRGAGWTYRPDVHWLRAGEGMSLYPVRACPGVASGKDMPILGHGERARGGVAAVRPCLVDGPFQEF